MIFYCNLSEVFSSKLTMIFDCILKEVEYWMKIFVVKIQQPEIIYLIVIAVFVSVLSLYRHQLIVNRNLCPRREDQGYHSPIKNYGYLPSPQQRLSKYSDYRTQQSSSIKLRDNLSKPKVGRSIYPQIDETIHPSGSKKKQKKTAADFKHPNVAFYSNLVPSEPNGDYIDNILTLWKGNYVKLEEHHGYIQWLFPNTNMGVNKDAYPLTDEEAKIIRMTPELREKVKASFEMMLDFYGMELTKENKVELAGNATERLKELNQWGNHNFRRISRILLALKLLGHSDLMLPWMKLFVDLIYVEKVFDHATESFENFWEKNLDAEDRIALNKYMNRVK